MNLETKGSYLNYFNTRRIPNAISVTLTLKQRLEITDCKGRLVEKLDPIKVSQNIRHFMNVLNQSVFGKGFFRFGKRLSVIPVIEGDSFVRLHVHMTLERPERIE